MFIYLWTYSRRWIFGKCNEKEKAFLKKVRLAFSWTGVTPQMNVESTVTFMVTGTIANTWHRPNRIGWQWIGN